MTSLLGLRRLLWLVSLHTALAEARAGWEKKAAPHHLRLLERLRNRCPYYAQRYSVLLQKFESKRVDGISGHMPSGRTVTEVVKVRRGTNATVYKQRRSGPIRIALSVSPANQGGVHATNAVKRDERLLLGQFWNFRVVVLSILFETAGSVELHVTTFPELASLLEHFLLELKTAMADVRAPFCFRMYNVDFDAVSRLTMRMGINVPSGIFTRTLLPLIMGDVNEVIYLDTDMFAVTDLGVLWDVFDDMPGRAAIVSIGLNQTADKEKYGATSGAQLLLRLEGLRNLKASIIATRAGLHGYLGAMYDSIRRAKETQQDHQRVHSITLAEQKIYGWLMDDFGLGGGVLAMQWNTQMCTPQNSDMPPDEVGIGFVHFNCMSGTTEYGRFAPMSEFSAERSASRRKEGLSRGASNRFHGVQHAAHTTYAFAFELYFELPLACLIPDFGLQRMPSPQRVADATCASERSSPAETLLQALTRLAGNASGAADVHSMPSD